MTASAFLRPAAVAGLGAAFACSASAAHIDFFSEGNESLFISQGGATSAQTTFVDNDGDTIPLGGNARQTMIAFAPGMTDGASFGAQIDSDDGTFAFSNTSESWAIFNTTYGTQGTLDLRSIPGTSDVYSSLRVSFEGIEYDETPVPGQSTLNGGIPTLTVTATDTDGDSDMVTQNLFDETVQDDYFFDFASFAGVDFSSLDTLDLQIDSNIEGADFTLDEVFRDNVIPEPASLAVLGLGGLLAARRRR